MAVVALSEALGNVHVRVVPEALWPLPVQTLVTVRTTYGGIRGRTGCILDFERQTGFYRVHIDSSDEMVVEHATSLYPSRVSDVNLIPDASKSLQKREHRCRFVDSLGEVRHFYFLAPTAAGSAGSRGHGRYP